MYAFSQPPAPAAPPQPETISGYVIQAMYGSTHEGRLTPFDPDDADFDLRFREWFPNGFATRAGPAQEVHQAQLIGGFQSRVLPGVAERQANGEFAFFTVH